MSDGARQPNTKSLLTIPSVPLFSPPSLCLSQASFIKSLPLDEIEIFLFGYSIWHLLFTEDINGTQHSLRTGTGDDQILSTEHLIECNKYFITYSDN